VAGNSKLPCFLSFQHSNIDQYPSIANTSNRQFAMHFTRALLSSNAARLTLYTRANCGLCDTAKLTVSKLQQRKAFDYAEVDIMVPEHKQWKDVYEFDVPVLHVQPSHSDKESELRKLFHRFSEAEVEKLVTEAER
jgi:glutaredoxin